MRRIRPRREDTITDERASPMAVKYIEAMTSKPIIRKAADAILKPLPTNEDTVSPAPKSRANFSPEKKKRAANIIPMKKSTAL